MTSNSPPTSLSDVLYAFSLAREVPDAGLLDEFTRRYPEHAAELTNFAIEIAVDVAQGSDEALAGNAEASVSPTVSRAMSRFQNRMFAVRQAQASNVLPPKPLASARNPFSSLDRVAFRGLASRLNANAVFLIKLRDRQIEPTTMTIGFRQRVADELNVPLDVLVSHFAATPEMQSAVRYKAEQKPHVGVRQTFEEAVRTSGLTGEQQNYLMSL